MTIAWDVDDVLNDLMRSWFEQEWLPAHPDCAVRYQGITENPPDKILGVTQSEYLESLDRFRLSPAARFLEPVREVIDWFRIYGYRFRHIALTATPLKSAHFAAEWVVRNYGEWIRSFNFVPSIRENQPVFVYDLSKADFLKWLGKVDMLIDDNPLHIEAARKMGIGVLIMPRPWNHNPQTISGLLNTLAEVAKFGNSHFHERS